jgi:methylphosphotriester-DNA--protein-cysteine methyltransferase
MKGAALSTEAKGERIPRRGIRQAVRVSNDSPEGAGDLEPDICWQAIRSRDRRFDGRFLVGAVTNHVYCRSTCPAPFAIPSNICLFACAAAAEAAGFRPCTRCRPESSPGTPAWLGTSAVVSRALRMIWQGGLTSNNVEELAERVGIGSRQLRRLFLQHLGASPIKVACTHRLHFAHRRRSHCDEWPPVRKDKIRYANRQRIVPGLFLSMRRTRPSS